MTPSLFLSAGAAPHHATGLRCSEPVVRMVSRGRCALCICASEVLVSFARHGSTSFTSLCPRCVDRLATAAASAIPRTEEEGA